MFPAHEEHSCTVGYHTGTLSTYPHLGEAVQYLFTHPVYFSTTHVTVPIVEITSFLTGSISIVPTVHKLVLKTYNTVVGDPG